MFLFNKPVIEAFYHKMHFARLAEGYMVLRKSSYKMIQESMANQAKHANNYRNCPIRSLQHAAERKNMSAGPPEYSTWTDDDIQPHATLKKTLDFIAPTLPNYSKRGPSA